MGAGGVSPPPKQMVSEFPTARASSERHPDTMALANSGVAGLHQAMKVLVLGASGGVGKHLVRLACDQGHIVTALVRRADGIDSRARILIDDVLRPGCFDE